MRLLRPPSSHTVAARQRYPCGRVAGVPADAPSHARRAKQHSTTDASFVRSDSGGALVSAILRDKRCEESERRIRPYWLARDEGDAIWMFDSLDTIKADADQTGGGLS